MSQISVRLKQSGIEKVGIVVDADTDLAFRWQSLKDTLTKSGYNVPAQPAPSGSIFRQKDLPTVGIWIMPNNQTNGMIEDFIKALIPHHDKTLPFAEQTLAELEKQELHGYQEVHRAKALIHTWLAWQESPGTPLGLAITKSCLTTNEELCQQFVDWLNELFQL